MNSSEHSVGILPEGEKGNLYEVLTNAPRHIAESLPLYGPPQRIEQSSEEDIEFMNRFFAEPPYEYTLENKPPGFAGVLALAIYRASYLPASQVAIAAMLGMLAGICGRAFETPTGKDLGLYIILVAQSGQGKDAIHEGIPELINLAEIPEANYFVRAIDFASGPALHKALLTSPGFLALQGEFGRKLKAMASLGNSPMQELRTVLTNAYSKNTLDGKGYSDSEKNLLQVQWPSLSFLGETTPGTFMESLTPDMMEDGFLSRFNVITYEGKRPAPNPNGGQYWLLPQELNHWREIIMRAVPYQGLTQTPDSRIRVGYLNADAKEKLYNFELECGDKINATDDESERQVYNRAALKAYKIASLLAVADNPLEPKIHLGHAAWAISAIRRDISAFVVSKKSGDVGQSDDARAMKLLSIIGKYLCTPPPESYKVPVAMQQKGIVPKFYLQKRITGVAAFDKHKAGQVAALDQAIKNLIECGSIAEVRKDRAVEEFSFHGRCFWVLNLPT